MFAQAAQLSLDRHVPQGLSGFGQAPVKQVGVVTGLDLGLLQARQCVFQLGVEPCQRSGLLG